MKQKAFPRVCIIGAAQRTVRKEEGPAPEPLALWEEVSRKAVADAGAQGDLLAAIQSVRLMYCESWRYDEPARRLTERLGIKPAQCFEATIGGHMPQMLVQTAGEAILRGELDVALICSGEALATVQRFQTAGAVPNWSFPARAERAYPHTPNAIESKAGFAGRGAPFVLSTIDNARRAQRGTGYAEYRRELGDLLAGMTEVAAQNPYAWFQRAQDADSIITPRADNRQITVPYTKQMVAMWNVDMAAALIIASDEAANDLGVPDERRVYLHGWCGADDPYPIGARPSISSSPAMRAASSEALRCAGIGMDDVRHLDLYCCFTSALNLARDALGVDDRTGDELTVTGGLPYSGGPGSCYVMHSLAAMTERLRNDPGSFGMVTGTGMWLNKQAFGIYSTRPPESGPRFPAQEELQRRLDNQAELEITADFTGPARVATFTVQYDRNQEPVDGVAICDVAEGVRGYARIVDPDVLALAADGEFVGRSVDLVQGPDCAVVRCNV